MSDKDWTMLTLGEDNSQTAPVCNGTVREMIAEITRLKGENDELMRDDYSRIMNDLVRWQTRAVTAEARIAELDGALEVQKVFTSAAIQVVGKYRTALEKIRGLKQNCQWPLSGKTNTPCLEEGVNNPWICEYCIATEAIGEVKDE